MRIQRKCILITAVLALTIPVLAHAQQRTPMLPKLDIWVEAPRTRGVQQPCPPTLNVNLYFDNNSLTDSITVDWSSDFILHDINCVADYTPKNGTVAKIPPQQLTTVPITLSFCAECKERQKSALLQPFRECQRTLTLTL